MSQLVPCPECQRHVRKSETRCPFCGEALSLAHVPAPVLPSRRLGRAATFAFGAGIVGATALVSCGGQDESHGVIPVPLYGGPPAGTGGISAAGAPVYGAPPSGGPNGGTSFGGNINEGGVPGDASFAGAYGAAAFGGVPGETTGNGGASGTGGDATGGVGGAAGNDANAGAAPVYGGPPGSGAGGV